MALGQIKKTQPTSRIMTTTAAIPSEAQKRLKFLLKLEGVLDSAEKVREVGELASISSVVSGTSDSEEARFFCHVDYVEKQAMLNGLKGIDFQSTFIKVSSLSRSQRLRRLSRIRPSTLPFAWTQYYRSTGSLIPSRKPSSHQGRTIIQYDTSSTALLPTRDFL